MVHVQSHQIIEFLSGATALGIVAHGVNSFPTPENKYGQWLLGLIKFAVGQRTGALNAFQGQDTVVAAVPRGTGNGAGSTTETSTKNVEITPDAIKTSSEKVTKTETVVPNPGPPQVPTPPGG